ncbi:MAG: class I SAM-dependent methyltransferase [Candidatus Hodarchaeota archaeon]
MKEKTKSTIYHDKIAAEYEEGYKDPYWQLYFQVTWHNLKKYLPGTKGARVLDAGGGTGMWSRVLAREGFKLVCADVSEKMLEVGRKLAKDEVLEGSVEFKIVDITDMSCFDDSTFDMVISQGDPVGYCDNPQEAVNELSRVAKEGAHVSVSVDSFYSQFGGLLARGDFKQLDSLLKTHVTEFDGFYPQYNFTVDELVELLENAGLRVVDVIGKTVFTRFFPKEKLNELLSDKEFFNKMLDMENNYNNEPTIVGLSGHIQAIGRKM